MFAYCNNSPVIFCDSSGTISATCIGDNHIFSSMILAGGGGGYDYSCAPTVSAAHSRKVIQNEIDYINCDDEQLVLQYLKRDGIAFYKGAFVFTTDQLGGSAFSFGIIGIGTEVLDSPGFANTLNHEYGHYVHMSMIGPVDYFWTTALPSLMFAEMTNQQKYPRQYYYDLPWERVADYLGGVERQYLPDTNTRASHFWIYTLIVSCITPWR